LQFALRVGIVIRQQHSRVVTWLSPRVQEEMPDVSEPKAPPLRSAGRRGAVAAWYGIWDAPRGADVWRGADSAEHRLLTHGDTVQAETAMLALLRRLENVHLQHGEGVFDRSVMGDYSFNSPLYRMDQFQRWWAGTRYRELFDAEFVQEFEEANALR